jgi:hypothetical protein
MIVCGGLPIMLLEIGLGQYMSKGGLKCWDICPLFQGVSAKRSKMHFSKDNRNNQFIGFSTK